MWWMSVFSLVSFVFTVSINLIGSNACGASNFYFLAKPDSTLCEGTLGDNILPQGDFGSGVANTPTDDPGLAPGYTYTTNTPPDDGFYTISNNTSDWGNFASGDWIDIQDNSDDPNGYMMVVNASFEPGLFYRDTVAICANTTYEFAADIINIIEPTLGGRILPNVDFLIDGNVLYQTGDIPQNATWSTVGFTFTTGNETFLVLELRNNAPGGTGNDLAIDNISFRPCGPQFEILVDRPGCELDTFSLTTQFEGISYETPHYQWQTSEDQGENWIDVAGAHDSIHSAVGVSGVLYRILAADNQMNLGLVNCRVHSDPIEIDLIPSTFYSVDTICSNDSIRYLDQIFNTAGYYEISRPADPCDSLFILDLEVIPAYNSTQSIFLCGDTLINFQDSTITHPGLYSFQLKSVNGCDSLIVLDVYQNPEITTLITDTVCGEPFYLFGEDSLKSSGIYRDTLISNFGCDSIVQLNLAFTNWEFDLPPIINIVAGDSAILPLQYKGNPFDISWRPSQSLSCSDCPNPIAFPATSTTYTGFVFGEMGCTDTVQIEVLVDLKIDYFIPNIFSPNGDGVNDELVIFGNENISQLESLQIYDRWGNLLVESLNPPMNNSQGSWDGAVNGANVNPGVYVLKLVFITIEDKPVLHHQTITVVR